MTRKEIKVSERRRPTQRRNSTARPGTAQAEPIVQQSNIQLQESHEVRKHIARPSSDISKTQQSERRQSLTRPTTIQERSTQSVKRPVLRQESQASQRPVCRPTDSTAQEVVRPVERRVAPRPVAQVPSYSQDLRPVNHPTVEPVVRPAKTEALEHHTIHSGDSVREKMAEAFKESSIRQPQTITINRESYEESLRKAEEEIRNVPLDDLIQPVPKRIIEEPKESQRVVEEEPEEVSQEIIEKVVERPVEDSQRNVEKEVVSKTASIEDEQENESAVEDGNSEAVTDEPEELEDIEEDSEEEPNSKKKDKKKKKAKSTKKSIIKWVLSLVILVGIFTGLRVSGVFATEMVVGTSMEPNYHTRDLTITSNLKELNRYDVVVATAPSGTEVIKRVIGMPGDTITYKNRHVYVNGVITDESFINSGEEIELNMSGKIELGDNEYFLVGDNRENSSDSRIYGPVSGDSIHGTVLVRIPLSFQF